MKRVPAKNAAKYVRPEGCPLNRETCWDERRGLKAVCRYYRGTELDGVIDGPVTVLCSAPSKKGEK